MHLLCGFCAIKSKECSRLSEKRKNYDGLDFEALECLNIFRSDVIELVLKDSNTTNICNKCWRNLQNCYEFVHQIRKAQKLLSQQQEVVKEAELALNSKTKGNSYRVILPKPDEDPPQPKSTVFQATKTISRAYKCCECPETFNSFRQLKAHEALHLSTADSISICEYCCSLYANAETLEKHQNESHTNGRFACQLCSKQYKSKGQLIRHMSRAHQRSELIYYCTLCPRNTSNAVQFASRVALQQHFQEVHLLMPSSQEEDDVEIEMNEEFLDEFLLTNENSFQLSECWDALDLHDMLNLHSSASRNGTGAPQNSAATYKCPKCYVDCLNQKMLLSHMKTHSMKPQCPYCDKCFNGDAHLRQHLRIVHALKKRHVCLLCDKLFATLDHLKKHVLSQHQNERKHVCLVCDKRFTQLCHLKQHLVIHTTGKTLQCTNSSCNATFWKKADLVRHILKNDNCGEQKVA